MKLSILDQSPLFLNHSAADALEASKELAMLADQLGYTRYWVTEHHNLTNLACPAPEVLLGFIGTHTKRIRLGAGAILLPHYQPYKVAEVFHTLATLFPGRIDLGLGRAPGGSAVATTALSPRFLEEVWNMPEKVDELLGFLSNSFPTDHLYRNLRAAPIPDTAPEPWLLGTSLKSARLAAEKGLSYAFGYFMSDKDDHEIFETYRKAYTGKNSRTILAVSVTCSETEVLANELAHWSQVASDYHGKGAKTLLTIEEARKVSIEDKQPSKLISGTKEEVKEKLKQLQADYHPDELMVTTITPNREDRLTSFRLLGEAFLQD
ncbi:LLM class flavin-dependent oxidoreductase [Pseudalkalibacillus hwajinpoensis]|uniref:LLM class flavin-dependent oxidoreductase n=1 Tax=Guptibacillus hwajinpoensis TaxID=208199 RepID=UPI00325B02D9